MATLTVMQEQTNRFLELLEQKLSMTFICCLYDEISVFQSALRLKI